jgi:serine protease Do
VEPLTPNLAAQLGLSRVTNGVVIDSVDPEGPAADAGLEQGDVIQEVNRQPVRSSSELNNALGKSGDRPPLLLVNRGGQRSFVAVPLSR